MADRPQGDPNDRRFVADLRDALAATAAADAIEARAAPDQLMEMIVRGAARAIPCPEGALMLVDRERDVLTFDVVIGSTAGRVRDLTVPLGHGIAGLVAVSGQALAVANSREDPRHAREIAEQSGYLPRTILAVPVVATDGSTVGVLELLDRQGQPTFGLDDMELLGTFAQQLALVLDMRRADDLLAARLATTLVTVGGLPAETAQALGARAAEVTARVDADDVALRTRELAELVAAIAARGPDEHDACVRVLRAFDDYLGSRPELGLGVFG